MQEYWDVGIFSSSFCFHLQIIGSLFVLSGVVARPDAKPQKGIDHTYGFVRYTNGAIVPEDTPSVRAVKSDFLMAKAYADSGFETVEVIGENTPDVYANIEEVQAQAKPYAMPQYERKGIDHTYNFVRYTNGAIVPDNTPSVKAVKSDFLMAKAYADSEFETSEIIGENTPEVYANIEEVEAKPYAVPQYQRKGIDHTAKFVRYTNGAIVPDDTSSVKAVKSDFLMAKAYADSEFETTEVIGENTPEVYANIEEVEAKPYADVPTSVVYAAKAPQPLKKVIKKVEKDEKTTPVMYAVNPFYQFYQPQVYGRMHQVVYQPHLYGMPAVRHFGKREAEAEPEAEAEAQFYNYYGNNYKNNYGNYYANYPTTYTTKAYGYSTYPYVVNGITYPTAYTAKYPTTYNAKYPTTYNTAYNRYPFTYGYNPYSLTARAPTSAVYATKAQPMPLRDYISYFNAQAQRRSNMVQTSVDQKRVTREAEAEPKADAQFYSNHFGAYTTPYSGYPNTHTAYTGYPNTHTTYMGYSNSHIAYTGYPYAQKAFKGYSYFSSPYTTYEHQYY